jgi:hypothetical protein
MRYSHIPHRNTDLFDIRCIKNFRDWCRHLYNSCSRAMILLAYLGSQCTKFHSAGWKRRIFSRPFIWSRVSGLMRFRNGCNKGMANVHQILCDDATFLSRVITGDESRICGYGPETKEQYSQWKSPISPRPKKVRQVKIKSRACS